MYGICTIFQKVYNSLNIGVLKDIKILFSKDIVLYFLSTITELPLDQLLFRTVMGKGHLTDCQLSPLPRKEE